MKLTLIDTPQTPQFDQILVSSSAPLTEALKCFTPASFTLIESATPINIQGDLQNKDIWKQLLSLLKDNGDLSLHLASSEGVDTAAIQSVMKMNGFVNVHIGDGVIQAKKPQWQAAGAPLKRNKPATQPTNPWASLQQNDANLINEDELMKDVTGEKQVFQKFCGEDDTIKAGKACANCTCGRKEIEEGKVTVQQLETGQVQSDCGKCYLGDAFRCASCPYLGKPAFEAGDKVQLKNSAVQQTQVDSEKITVKTTGTKVTLDI